MLSDKGAINTPHTEKCVPVVCASISVFSGNESVSAWTMRRILFVSESVFGTSVGVSLMCESVPAVWERYFVLFAQWCVCVCVSLECFRNV